MSDCPRICITAEEFDATIHKLISVHATEEECLLACECADSSTSGQSSSSESGQSSSSESSSTGCLDNEANLQISGDVEISAGVWNYLDNEIFTPVDNAAAGLWPPLGDRAWTSSSGNFYIRFNSSAPGGGRWELLAFERISHKAELNGADPETSRPWTVTFLHAPTGSEPDPSAALSVTRVCPQQPAASSSSSGTPFFTCEPEDASIRLTADFKFDGASGPITSVNNLILSQTSSAEVGLPSPITWAGTTNGRTIYILYIPSENEGDSWNRWLIGWPHPTVNQFTVAYRSNVAAAPFNSVPWLAELTYEGVYDHAGMTLSSLNVEKYCI